jgi:hypothetical protein
VTSPRFKFRREKFDTPAGESVRLVPSGPVPAWKSGNDAVGQGAGHPAAGPQPILGGKGREKNLKFLLTNVTPLFNMGLGKPKEVKGGESGNRLIEKLP